MAIVIVTGKNGVKYEEPFYHGIFKDGDSASRWGFDNCNGLDWHWQEIALQVLEENELPQMTNLRIA